jgi:periplasmic protein TonB
MELAETTAAGPAEKQEVSVVHNSLSILSGHSPAERSTGSAQERTAPVAVVTGLGHSAAGAATAMVGQDGVPQQLAAIGKQTAGGEQQTAAAPETALQPPRVLERIDPVYSEQARKQGWEGKVILRLEILTTGKAGAVAVEHSSGHSELDEAAAQAVRRWLFAPARDTASGTLVPCITTIPLVFRLN